MNIQQAKQLPLKNLVEQLGGKFSHRDAHGNAWYFSPFRPDERTASFKVDEKTNKWHDFARTHKFDAHGDIIDLWTDYNNLPRRSSDAIKQALKAFREEFGSIRATCASDEKKLPRITSKAPRYRLIKQPGKIWIDSLKKEVGHRNLSLAIVQDYIKQAQIEDLKTKKRYYGFALLNDKGGYEISIPNPYKKECFKTVIGPKAITMIADDHNTTAYVFEGFWDCLTWIGMKQGNEKGTFFILNSTSLIYELANKIITNKYRFTSILLFLDNDKAGQAATHKLLELLEPHNLTIGTMNHIYDGYKDLNDFWCKRDLRPIKPTKKVGQIGESPIPIYKV